MENKVTYKELYSTNDIAKMELIIFILIIAAQNFNINNPLNKFIINNTIIELLY